MWSTFSLTFQNQLIVNGSKFFALLTGLNALVGPGKLKPISTLLYILLGRDKKIHFLTVH